jgi:DNA polymerase III epsilon subunit-like protein
VAYAHNAADYNGHWGVREICDICPAAQQQRCASDYRQPAPADMDRVLSQLGYETPYLIEDGHVWTHGLGEQRRYAIQHTLRHPGRPIRRRPWISPGLTPAVLAATPAPADVGPELARRTNGRIIVGHNVGVDWRLLHRRCPAITPTAFIDTLRLARHLKLGTKNSLTALTAQLDLTPEIERLAAGSQPHRALWDTLSAGGV